MYLMYYLDESGNRVYTLKKLDPSGTPTLSAHPGVIPDMPRKHRHKLGTPYRRNYPHENMERALLAVVDNQYPFKQAAEMHGVPKSTRYDIYRGEHSDKLGRPLILYATEERWIVYAMTIAGKFGYPFERQAIKDFVSYYLNGKGVNITMFRP